MEKACKSCEYFTQVSMDSGKYPLGAKNMLLNLQLLKHMHIARDVYKAIWKLSSHFVERGPDPQKNPVSLLILHLLTTVIGGTIVVWLAHLMGMKIAFDPDSVLFALFSAFA